MLLNLHVKNFALIEEAEIDFGQGLNILTGETGAGKSILIDAVNAALGGRIRGDVIRHGCDYAYTELVFSVTEPEKQQALSAMDISTEYDCIVVSRRILPGRSIHKINDETVTSAKVRMATSLLMDIHGQHEHQSLLDRKKHLEILDQFGGHMLEASKDHVAEAWKSYRKACKEAESYSDDPETRLRQMDFLQFEIQEIQDANMKPHETEELGQRFKKMQNSQKICSSLQQVLSFIGGGQDRSACDRISCAAREMADISRLDSDLQGLHEEIVEIEDLISGFSREVEDYLSDLSWNPEEYLEMEERLNLLHHLESKYGSGWEAVLRTLEEKEAQLAHWQEYERLKQEAEEKRESRWNQYLEASRELSELRRQVIPNLKEELEEGIRELNFAYVDFRIEQKASEHPGPVGMDDVEFLVSLNDGQAPQALGKVASGGELSRIMLAIKAALAHRDEIPTLIFDEIDTGISGRTAQKVSEKLDLIGRHRQVICITHLPQIASMADHHYGICKASNGGSTISSIRKLDERSSVEELARLLGGAEMTETVYQNACEMKELASRRKGLIREWKAAG